jgi:hypothetical protein
MKRLPSAGTFLPLKSYCLQVLTSLADQERHGYRIMQEVPEGTAGKVRLWTGELRRLIYDEELIEALENLTRAIHARRGLAQREAES